MAVEDSIKIAVEQSRDRRINTHFSIRKEVVTSRVAIWRINARNSKESSLEKENSHRTNRPSASDHEPTRDKRGRYKTTQPQECTKPKTLHERDQWKKTTGCTPQPTCNGPPANIQCQQEKAEPEAIAQHPHVYQHHVTR